MEIRAAEISEIIRGQIKDYEKKVEVSETGTVLYESGIHIDCLAKNAKSYQLVDPEESGAGNIEYIIGKHSGKAVVKMFFAARNIILSEAELNTILPLIKEYWFDNADRVKELQERLLAP